MADILQTQPQNPNFLKNINHRFSIKRLPSVTYFCQEIKLPDIYVPPAQQQTALNTLPWPGEKVSFSTLSLSFKVDEDMTNYLEIQDWMYGIGLFETQNAYKTLESHGVMSGEGVMSDASAIIMSSKNNPIFDVTFKNIWPTSLSIEDLTTTDPDFNHLNARVEFQHAGFRISKIV